VAVLSKLKSVLLDKGGRATDDCPMTQRPDAESRVSVSPQTRTCTRAPAFGRRFVFLNPDMLSLRGQSEGVEGNGMA
jgi:hypothetical protein